MDRFSERLRELREEEELTQTQLANISSTNKDKISPQNISYWEKGRQPSFEILIKLASYFDVTVDYLIGVSNFKNSTQKLVYTNLDMGSFLEQLDIKHKSQLIENVTQLTNRILNLYIIDKKSFDPCLNILEELCLFLTRFLAFYNLINENKKDTFKKHLRNSSDLFSLCNSLDEELNFLDLSQKSIDNLINSLLKEF
ncbi:helix-turn-helix transcriptional regulator [Clostridium sp. PL3]|uniref:Helix-turn-helix transcriptional regulator n=1 Tax=Clostridium thailandense TaxID=2794346 RepID=A0A949TZ06_9CLOT|nr:helix-turn-helix transcriptional regulator [Clostridium thailandense]MBV7274411.1 helix-turn-helix transcriptional regulator [Clostridium thailandense]